MQKLRESGKMEDVQDNRFKSLGTEDELFATLNVEDLFEAEPLTENVVLSIENYAQYPKRKETIVELVGDPDTLELIKASEEAQFLEEQNQDKEWLEDWKNNIFIKVRNIPNQIEILWQLLRKQIWVPGLQAYISTNMYDARQTPENVNFLELIN